MLYESGNKRAICVRFLSKFVTMGSKRELMGLLMKICKVSYLGRDQTGEKPRRKPHLPDWSGDCRLRTVTFVLKRL